MDVCRKCQDNYAMPVNGYRIGRLARAVTVILCIPPSGRTRAARGQFSRPVITWKKYTRNADDIAEIAAARQIFVATRSASRSRFRQHVRTRKIEQESVYKTAADVQTYVSAS